MSAPQVLKLALEACRPVRPRHQLLSLTSSKSSQPSTTRIRPLVQGRFITTAPRLHEEKPSERDITTGFPMPEADADSENVTADVQSSSLDAEATPSSGVAPSSRAGEGFAAPPKAAQPAVSQGAGPSSTLDSVSNPSSETAKPESEEAPEQLFPPNVLATHLAPMRHQPKYGVPVASLQLRSYSIRNLEFFADLCMRAAFYLKMPARGPVPLPRRTERWTTLRSNFVHKKSQENFERITYKRLITVMDGDKSAVEAWLAYVRKWQFYGVGMKANVWEFEGVDVAKNMDKDYNEEISKHLDEKLNLYGWKKNIGQKATVQNLLLNSQRSRNVVGAPMANVRNPSMSREMRGKTLGIDDSAKS